VKALACIGFLTLLSVIALAEDKPEKQDDDAKKKNEWVQSCLKDFESIKAGMTREQVEKKFPMDGGLQTASPTRFVHPQCRYFKIEVGFEFQRDEADGNRAVMGKTDKVIAVSKPYLERPFAD
jgi:hypothetical protein